MNRIFDSRKWGKECITSQKVLDGSAVGMMYRQRPLEPNDSGWRFFTGQETGDYLKAHTVITDLENICMIDNRVTEYLDLPWGAEITDSGGTLKLTSAKRNYKRVINRITTRIGKIDHIEKRENSFPAVLIKNKNMILSLSATADISEYYIHLRGRPYEYHYLLLNQVKKSGADEGDIVVFHQSDDCAGGLVVNSPYGSWLLKIEILNRSMLGYAMNNSAESLMNQIKQRG